MNDIGSVMDAAFVFMGVWLFVGWLWSEYGFWTGK